MSTNQYITLIGILVTAGVALLAAYLQRLQMRQIEAFRIDPSAGLIPPPNPVWKFVKTYWLLFSGGGLAVALVSVGTGPLLVTQTWVLVIATGVGMIFFLIMGHFVGLAIEMTGIYSR